MSGNQQVAVGVMRASREEQVHSNDDQTSEIRDWCEESGHELIRVFEDEGISGSELNRPGIRALLAFLESTPLKGTVVLWKRNRLARPDDCRDGMFLEHRIESLGWKTHFLHGAGKSGNALIDTILSAVEYHEGGQYLRNLSVDTMRGLLRRILDGDCWGGKIPYGYAKVITGQDGAERVVARRAKHRKLKEERTRWVPGDEAEVEVVAWMFESYATGQLCPADLAGDLNTRGIPAPQGGEWRGGTIRDILVNPIYTGDMVWNRETTSKFFRLAGGKPSKKGKPHQSSRPGRSKTTSYAANDPLDWITIERHHPALVSHDLFERCRLRRESRGRQRGGRRQIHRAYALSGLVFCGNCGGRMNGHSTSAKGNKYRRYSCSSYFSNRSCSPYFVDADQLENAVIGRLRQNLIPEAVPEEELRGRIVELLRKRFASADPGLDASSLAREQKALERKVKNGLDHLGNVSNPTTAQQLLDQIGEWNQRIGELRQQLATARKRASAETQVQQAADEILGLLGRLDQTIRSTPRAEQREFFAKAVDRIELSFQTETPEETGRKRNRHTFVGGSVRANALLEVASRALASCESSSGWIRT